MKKPVSMTREELYSLVWSEPVSKLAARFSLSDKGLAKKCKRHNIPCPPLGYWAKKQNGQKVEPTPLPRNTDITLDTIMFWPKPDTASQEQEVTKHHLTESQLSKALAFEIPKRVNRYDPVIAACRASTKEKTRWGKTDNYGRYTFGRDVPNPGFKVTAETFDRACLFLEGLIRLFEDIGWAFTGGKNKRGEFQKCGFSYQNELLTIEIKELVKKKPPEPKSKKERPFLLRTEPDFSALSYPASYKSTGILEFAIDTYGGSFQKRWKDNGDIPIEHHLAAITQSFSRAFEFNRLQRIEREKERREWERKEDERKEMLRLAKIEEKRRSQFFQMAADYDKVSRLNKLISAIEALGADDERTQNWLIWARVVTEELDPLKQHQTLLDEFERLAKKDDYLWSL